MSFFAAFSYLAAYLISEHRLEIGETATPLAIVGVGAVIGSAMAGPVTAMERRAQVVAGCTVIGGLAAFVLFSFDISVWGTVGDVAPNSRFKAASSVSSMTI